MTDKVKKYLSLLMLLLVIDATYSQSNIRLSNYWENTFSINPAVMNSQSLVDVSLAARKQWVKFPGSPSSFFTTATLYNDDLHTQFGLRAIKDIVGYTSSLDVDLTYSYSFRMSQLWNAELGLAASYQTLRYDMSKVTFENPDDPSAYERLSTDNNFNADIGFEFASKLWRVGGASQHLLSLFSPVNKRFTNTNFLYCMYRPSNHDYINIGYGLCGIQYANTYQMELNLTAFFKETEARNAFQIGVLYRSWTEMGLSLGLDLSKSIKLTYTYDYNIGGISHSSFGTHELILRYRLDRQRRCRNCWF